MTDQFTGEIRIFPLTFAPVGWAFCDGQLMPITQNTALFSLLGTMHGGNGQSTFALPDMQGAAPMHWGQGSGLSSRTVGEIGGVPHVTLLESEIPAHTHQMRATSSPADVSSPTPTTPLARSTGKPVWHAPDANSQPLAPTAVAPVGADLPHSNLMPYLVFNFCIALQGIYPQRP
jgi:microcystin-dependent protein